MVWAGRSGGEERQFYTGTVRADDDCLVPYVDRGTDVAAVGSVLFEELERLIPQAHPIAGPDPDQSAGFEITMYEIPSEGIDKRLGELPWEPDDELR